MRHLAFIFTTMLALGGSPAKADIRSDMQIITQYCSHYVLNGQRTTQLMQAGFEQRGREFRKSYNRSVIGGTLPVINVDARESRSGLGCSATFGIVGSNDGAQLMSIAAQTLRSIGYAETTVTTSNGRQERAFVNNGIAVQLGGSTQYQNSTYTAVIYLQRLN